MNIDKLYTSFSLHLDHLIHHPHQHHHDEDHDHQGWEDLGGDNCYKLALDQWVSWGEAHTNCWMEVNYIFVVVEMKLKTRTGTMRI